MKTKSKPTEIDRYDLHSEAENVYLSTGLTPIQMKLTLEHIQNHVNDLCDCGKSYKEIASYKMKPV